jgi:2-polyprenyl-6-methoxyphenol hydroxylase-like FAD-dependent oxidoreductase
MTFLRPRAVFDATATVWPQSFEANYAYLEETPVSLTALPDRRWRVCLRPTFPDSDLVDDATAKVAHYHPEVALEQVANPTRFHCHTKGASRFRAGPVLIAGDGAQVRSPAQGHGMKSGIQNAFNRASTSALVCRGTCDSWSVGRAIGAGPRQRRQRCAQDPLLIVVILTVDRRTAAEPSCGPAGYRWAMSMASPISACRLR